MPQPPHFSSNSLRWSPVFQMAMLVLVCLALLSSSTLLAAQQPNVLLIMTDDQGWGDISSHGNEMLKTPVLDALAASGARFDRFYVSPVCAPTRASLLTGRYNLRTGVHGVTRGEENMRAEETTIAEAFRAAGYATGCFGKWHNGAHWPNHPNGQGFDEFLGFCSGHWNNYFNTLLDHNGEVRRHEGFIIDVLTDAAIEFMENNRERPFFCYVPINTPHTPWQVPDKYFERATARGLKGTTACAYAMCENTDDNVGRMLAKLDELKLADDTIVLFLTDNGANTQRYNDGMRGYKGSVHEGGSRVPLFVRWPGHIEPGTEIKQIAAHVDLFPTLIELCGVAMPKTLPHDGLSLAPLLRGVFKEPWPNDRRLYTFRKQGNERGAVRTQRWRAVFERNRWQLFDMQADPGQKKDVSNKHPKIAAELAAAYKAKQQDVTSGGFDVLPIPIGYAERSRVVMPGHEAFLKPEKGQGISYVGRNGWANDWVTNWTDTKSFPQWEVDVVRGGRYEITLRYVCAKENLGARLRVEIGGRSVEGVVSKEHNPQPLHSPDRVPRKEVYEKEWARLKLGVVELKRGRTQLTVHALSKPGKFVLDLKAVEVRRVD